MVFEIQKDIESGKRDEGIVKRIEFLDDLNRRYQLRPELESSVESFVKDNPEATPEEITAEVDKHAKNQLEGDVFRKMQIDTPGFREIITRFSPLLTAFKLLVIDKKEK